ncbi:hypothetical protein [Streptomyces sp. NPDC047061]|uniref:MmyB family transcriptional regulator n=1 Tax=Streptomyces sp. NPDC047061 TaxID=3154605 RepID=UPI0033E8E43D
MSRPDGERQRRSSTPPQVRCAGDPPSSDDRRLTELVGRLAVQCDEFASRWARRPVRTRTSGVKQLRHPPVGTTDLSFENLVIPGSSGRRLIACTAEPGSPSEAALRLLGSTVAREIESTTATV